MLPGATIVWEYLVFNHSLRLVLCSGNAQQRAIHQVLKDLGLTHVMHSMIGHAFTHSLLRGERTAVELLTMRLYTG